MLNTMLEKSGKNWCLPLISEFGGTTTLFVHYRIVLWTIFTALRHVPLHLVSSGVLSWRDGDVNINKYTYQRGIYLNEDYSFKKWVNALPAFGLDCEGGLEHSLDWWEMCTPDSPGPNSGYQNPAWTGSKGISETCWDTQICMAIVAAWPLDTNMASDFVSEPRFLHSLQWQIGDTDITADPGYRRAMNPDMVFGNPNTTPGAA